MKRIPLLTDNELQALAGLIDAGVRATGIRSVRDPSALLDKLEAAEDVEEPKPEETE